MEPWYTFCDGLPEEDVAVYSRVQRKDICGKTQVLLKDKERSRTLKQGKGGTEEQQWECKETNSPPETKKHEHHPQKYPPWLPWLISLLLLLICIALVVVLLVAPFSHSSEQPTALQEKFTAWECDSAVPENQGQGWMCCPKGWKRFQKTCYFLSPDKMSWAESEQNCTEMGSHLVVINSREEQEFLFNLAKEKVTNAYETKYYIGLTYYQNGQWRWVDHTPYEKIATFWKPGEPNLLFAERCAAIHIKGKRDSNTYSNWNNILCFTSCYRICELAVKFV